MLTALLAVGVCILLAQVATVALGEIRFREVRDKQSEVDYCVLMLALRHGIDPKRRPADETDKDAC